MKPIIPLLLAAMSWSAAADDQLDKLAHAKGIIAKAMRENLTLANWSAPEHRRLIEVSHKTMDAESLECSEVALKGEPKVLCTIKAKPEAILVYRIEGLHFVFSFDAQAVERIHVIPQKD